MLIWKKPSVSLVIIIASGAQPVLIFMYCKLLYILFDKLALHKIAVVRNKAYLFVILIYASLAWQSSFAQTDTTAIENQQEVWPELNVYYRINDNFRIFSTLSGTKESSSSYSEGAYSIYLDYFGLKAPISKLNFVGREEQFRFRLRGGYLYSRTPPTVEDEIKSHTIRFQTSNTFSMSPKFRAYYKGKLDMVISNGDFNARYIPHLRLERDFKTEYLTFSGYTFVERYLDFQGRDLDRTRVAAGANLRVSKIIDFEIYYLYQFKNKANVPNVIAIGSRLKFYLSRKVKVSEPEADLSRPSIEGSSF
ncbi:Protein of unknown function [Algoriphagus locisalis]|uniref:DUF2490 domain-containing protein n=1 Tax=Algoriphagus locisalis TaxID=305507 RepID=A0A1I7CRP8_9BACT|nr:DUF2490 domain-containing protein [Algoriphagus locisalis]SFU02147.1 Protein of unknown function [Algoriphagus locisalis]